MIDIANFLEKTSEIWVALINGIFLLVSIKIGSGVAEKLISNNNTNSIQDNSKKENSLQVNINIKPTNQINPDLVITQEIEEVSKILTQ